MGFRLAGASMGDDEESKTGCFLCALGFNRQQIFHSCILNISSAGLRMTNRDQATLM